MPQNELLVALNPSICSYHYVKEDFMKIEKETDFQQIWFALSITSSTAYYTASFITVYHPWSVIVELIR